MFQRFKGFNLDSFLDNKIAEEQARQHRGGNSSSPSGGQRSSSRTAPSRAGTASPSKRSGNSKLKAPEAATKGPDPEDFVIGDDASDISGISRTATPKPVVEGQDAQANETTEEDVKDEGTPVSAKAETEPEKPPPANAAELPEDVRKKLVRLDNLTSKYQDLLRNYRTAHARVSAIEPFEATLREHTPLTSIADPGALVEYLNQRSLQSEMIMEELKRISGEQKDLVKERDELKKKVDAAEQRAKEAFDEAAGLRKEREESITSENVPESSKASDPLDVSAVNQDTSSNTKNDDDETFFSYETELPRLEKQAKEHETKIQEQDSEIREQREYINELSTENATLKNDLEICQLDLNAMQNKVGIKEREIESTRTELEEVRSNPQIGTEDSTLQQATRNLEDAQRQVQELEGQKADVERKLSDVEAKLKQQEEDHAAALKTTKSPPNNEKRVETLQNLLNTIRQQLKDAEEGKRSFEGQVKDLQFEISKMEAEAGSRADVIMRLRGQEEIAERLKKELASAEEDRDTALRLADTKRGHESAVASLRSQLKKAEKDRDMAYQMIIDCGRCERPAKPEDQVTENNPAAPSTEASSTPQVRSRVGSETADHAEASTPLTEISTTGQEGDASSGKKKNNNKKKKSKAKKKAVADDSTENPDASAADKDQPSVDELVQNPEKAKKLLQTSGQPERMYEVIVRSLEKMQQNSVPDGNGLEETLRHHEGVIEERDNTISYQIRMIKEKDFEIEGLNKKIEEKVALIEELNVEVRAGREREEEKDNDHQELVTSLTDVGNQVTGARAARDEAWWAKNKLQEEFDELQTDCDGYRRQVKEAQAQRNDLQERYGSLEKEMAELKAIQASASNVSSDELESIKEQLVNATKEKEAVQAQKELCGKQIEELKAAHESSGAELDAKHKSLTADMDGLRSKTAGLETDLAAANQLAQTRFKDLTELKERLGKIQPELRRLREESSELQSLKQISDKQEATIKRLEGKERDLRSEITEYKSQASEKEKRLSELQVEMKKINERSSALEDTNERARKDLEANERLKDEAVDARDKLQRQLDKTQAETKGMKSKHEDLEQQVKKLQDESRSLREELELKSGQQASSQSYVDSMQDQTREIATQMKEARARCDSLEEELADAQRLLSERSREGETMRRLLNEVEGRAESRVKEMRERMDLAVEERDRAEDEAASIGRKKSREIDDLKNKLKDAEREFSRATDAKSDAEKREQDYKVKHGDLERRAAQAQEEVDQVRSAMSQLQSSLDEGEKQSRGLEKERSDLRKALEERESKLEKLQKSSRAMAEELRAAQASKFRQGSLQSGPSSRESSRSRIASPAPKPANGSPSLAGTAAQRGGSSDGSGAIDTVYLKHVLLQFMEQKEKKHQMQLVPVLGMLLQFDKQDEQKWMSAISAR